MKKMILIGLLMSVSAVAQPHVFPGVDQEGRECHLSLSNVKVSQPEEHDACDFESDGKGPWCEGKPSVYVVHVWGEGEYVTAAGSVSFKIDDENVILDQQGHLTAMAGDPADGGTVSINLEKTENTQGSVYFYFPTAYGKTLTSKQIIQALEDRSSGRNYSDIWKMIYTDVTCTLK